MMDKLTTYRRRTGSESVVRAFRWEGWPMGPSHRDPLPDWVYLWMQEEGKWRDITYSFKTGKLTLSDGVVNGHRHIVQLDKWLICENDYWFSLTDDQFWSRYKVNEK